MVGYYKLEATLLDPMADFAELESPGQKDTRQQQLLTNDLL